MDSFLNIENEQIGQFEPHPAVEFFGALLHAEARRLNVSPEIRISERITVADGGIDASTRNMEAASSELIKSGLCGFQIKTGTSFTLKEPSLRKELFGERNRALKKNLGKSVARCLDEGGNLIFVCFGLDPVDSQIDKATKTVKKWLKSCGYPDAKVYFWGQSAIKGFLLDFPSLRLKVNGRGGNATYEILESWKSHADMNQKVFKGKAQEDIIQEIRRQLLSNTEAVHIRVTGESGIGKTRLVLESLDVDEIRPLAIYTDNPIRSKSQFLSYIGMPDNNTEIVLVLDECSAETASDYWNRVQTLGKRIRLITIYNEENNSNGRTKPISLPSLEEEEIAEILRLYAIPEEHIRRWASFCEGSPRWAHIIGQNLQNNSKDILADPDNVRVVDRYIAGRDNPRSKPVRDRKLIICFLSLFKRVGFKGSVSAEADEVFGIINKYDSSITRACFDDCVRDLHDRKILQGDNTYYITPKPLQVKLWIEWWEKYSGSVKISDFFTLSQSLVEGFHQMFRFAQESETAMKTVETLLGEKGPFADGKIFHEEKNASFFLTLTEAAPAKALERLEETIGNWTKEDIATFTSGRREIIYALERIAIWKELFVRAMKVLIHLAEAENDTIYSNNSTGVFKSFFSVFSPTEESPLKRLPLIEKLISSKNPIREDLAIKAIDVALSDSYTRVIGAEYQGLKQEPSLWSPYDNLTEVREYVDRVLSLLVSSLGTLTEANQKSAVQIIENRLQALGRTQQTSDKALGIARKLLSGGQIDKNTIVKITVSILHYGKKEISEETWKRWHNFYSELVTEDLSSLLNRYVGMNLIEDYFTEEGRDMANEKDKRIAELAQQALQNQDILLENLPWLVSEKAANGYLFGYHLGKRDGEKKILDVIIEARRNCPQENRPSQYFIGGYLRSVFEENPKKWERLFEKLSKDEDFVSLMPELAWRAGYNDNIMEHLLGLIENGKINPILLSFFKYGVFSQEINETIFEKFIRVLIKQKDRKTSSIALDVFARYYTDEDSTHELSKNLGFEIITDLSFFNESNEPTDGMDEYLWSKVADKFLDKFGSDKKLILKIGNLMLESMGNTRSILYHDNREAKEILTKITESYPDEMWPKVLDVMEDKGYFIFKNWISTNPFFSGDDQVNTSLLQKIKLETLWAWIESDIDKRAWYIASLVPKIFSNEPGEICLAREILIRYGDRKDVRRNLLSNFFSEGWSGLDSEHHQKQLDSILPLRDRETEPNVLRWLDEYIERRRQAIERAKIEEEREDY